MLLCRFPAAPARLRLFFATRLAGVALSLAGLAGMAPMPAQAQEKAEASSGAPVQADAPEDYAFHGQTTYIWQRKPSFGAAYSGANSLTADRTKSYSFSTTLDLGLRLWRGAEFHFNPEVTQGVPFSELHGLGGLSNGELAKVSSTNPVFYRARAFVRQTWGLGGGSEQVDADFNQLAGSVDKRRVVLTAGNFGVLDVFDQNEYGSDPRTQFMNWSFMAHGSFDYPADARGYNWGVALEYVGDMWSVRLGRFLQPLESNGLELDTRMFKHYGDILEFEKRYNLAGQPGVARLLLWRNKARMGAFSDAAQLGAATGATPDVANVREEHAKIGAGLSLMQRVNESLGVFARANMSDDKTETYAFTEIGRQVAAGGVLNGNAWGRPRDVVGLALSVNMLGSRHQAYLAAGGQGAFLGDGALRYGPEQVVELFYSFQPVKYLSISPDFQYIRNPGYNRDRGPAKFYGVRLHAEF
ncbi:carbohydrate porin [Cupriavidus sp. YAF13]|uniref:carbohydrate porin n=1 Tax=Cupriavidus sp. YAF13 TaxID=3233075 RepID=UPI003F8DC359